MRYGGDPPIRIRSLILPTLATASTVFAILLICLVGALSLPGADDTIETYLTYFRGRGYAVAVFRDRVVVRTSKPLKAPPLGPWVPGAVDVDVWVRSRRQTWSQRRFLGFHFFAGENVTSGLGQHPFLPDAAVTRIRHYDMEHAVAVPHWASIAASLVLPALWWSRRRREAREAGLQPRAAFGPLPPSEPNNEPISAATSPSAPGPR